MADPALSDDDLAAWLWLLHSAGLGRDGARRLLAQFGSPQGVLAASVAQRQAWVSAPVAAALSAPPEGHGGRLARTQSWLHGAAQRRVMLLGDSDYPPLLLNTADPPLLLYLEGRVELLNHPALAIVGSRRATPQALDNARLFAKALCAQGYTIVSGMALGIDGAAHQGALAAVAEGAEASTVAVVGTGLDLVYPQSHRTLAARIVAQGLLVSEMCLGTPPLPANFPLRNRIIAGLARGTLVVEAALPSGSLITAKLAADAGREVMAIPGSIASAHARGCHDLIRQGAALVTSPEDVLAELGAPPRQSELPLAGKPAQPDAPDKPDPVLRALGHDPASLDALIARCGWPAPALSAHLLALELDGLVARLPGGLYQRRQPA